MKADALPPACLPDDTGRCSICGDEGRVGVVLPPEDSGRTRSREVRVRFDGGIERVAVDLLEDVRAGERVVVHMGFAIGRLREDAAGRRGIS